MSKYDVDDEVFFEGKWYSTKIEGGDDGSGLPHQVMYMKDQQVWVADNAVMAGDMVLVTEGMEEGDDWAPDCVWHEHMDKYVGQALRILKVEEDGLRLDCGDGESWLFPFYHLTKVDLSADPRMFMPVLVKTEKGEWDKDYYVTKLPNGKHLVCTLGEVAEVVPLPLREATKSMDDRMDRVIELATQYWDVCPLKFKNIIHPKLVKSLREMNKELLEENGKLLSLVMKG